MGLGVNSELLYKNLSKIKKIKTSKHAKSDVQNGEDKLQVGTTTLEGFKFSNTRGGPNDSFRVGKGQRSGSRHSKQCQGRQTG